NSIVIATVLATTLLSASSVFASTPVKASTSCQTQSAVNGWSAGSPLYVQLKAAFDGLVKNGTITQAQEDALVAEYIPATK
ncbi:MAG TPA: hypothetical protein VN456_07065, partial [Desulfosporosinus sp.]|nr:hypothetical protein [Desulfosporosinus sp.]